jgi:hypothetical protein
MITEITRNQQAVLPKKRDATAIISCDIFEKARALAPRASAMIDRAPSLRTGRRSVRAIGMTQRRIKGKTRA